MTIGDRIDYPGWVVSDAGDTPIGELAEGNCIDDAKLAMDETIDEVRSVDVVDCATPHDTEILGRAMITGDAYFAEDDTVYQEAVHAACVPLFEAWTGGSYDSVLDLDYGYYVVPTIKTRLTTYDGVCTIYNIDDVQLIGTTKGAAAVGA